MNAKKLKKDGSVVWNRKPEPDRFQDLLEAVFTRMEATKKDRTLSMMEVHPDLRKR